MADEVSYREGEKLKKSGEWMTQKDLRKYIEDQVNKHMGVILVEPSKAMLNDEQFAKILDILNDDLAASVEHKMVAPRPLPPGAMGFPTGRGEILKVGPTVKQSISQCFSLVGATLAIGHTSGLARIFAVKQTIDSVRQLFSIFRAAWERLDDSKEFLVFEVIVALCGKLTVINYDAEAQRDYEHAYGSLAPTFEDILEAVVHHPLQEEMPTQWRSMPPEELRNELHQTMSKLQDRNILNERDGRWSIVF